ncbi:MAG: cobalamin-dependent protein [Rhodobacteraceae bacterium]|nr:cobalamin-dependent protein [Paracoccaceae bacterium]
MTTLKEDYVTSIADMDEDKALEITQQLIDAGEAPMEILGLCRSAMEIVGQRFEQEEYFLPELMMAGDILEQIGTLVRPLMDANSEGSGQTVHGTVLIGTVHGDLHDIGKNIVTFMLELNGFKVIDLGIDVSTKAFLDAIDANKPDIVGLSGFLTLAFDAMKETLDAFDDAGVRKNFKVMIGGGQVDDQILKFTGADAFGINAMEAVSLCRKWTGVAA